MDDLCRDCALSRGGSEMKRLTMNATITLTLGLGLTLALLWLLSGGSPAIRAQGPDGYSTYYVAPSCTGLPEPCYTTVQAAVDDADDPDDVVKVAAGTYSDINTRAVPSGYLDPPASGVVTQVVYIDKDIALRGGYTTAFTEPPHPNTNLTILDAQGKGRVILIIGEINPTIEGLHVTNGDASGLGGGPWGGLNFGGGALVMTGTATIANNQIFGSTADVGSGLYLYNSTSALNGNTISSNTNSLYGGGLRLRSSNATLDGNIISSNSAWSGGGLCLYSSDATLMNNAIITNTATESGGGLRLYASAATLTGNTVVSNTSDRIGGGLYLDGSDATLSGNTINGNIVRDSYGDFQGGGGVALSSSTAALNGNTIISNTANRSGGGLLLSDSDATLINNVVAGNRADGAGSGLYIHDSSIRLLHSTVAHNIGGSGSGVHVTDLWGTHGMAWLTNTILVSHTVGITVTAGSTVTLEATLWGSGAWVNDANWGGDGTVITGTVNVWGDPAFVDPDAGDYHLSPVSAAVDTGVDAGVTDDMDGHDRPFDGDDDSIDEFDIGADEYVKLNYIFLPLVLKEH
jgi:parallel beta-helix repeat protein